MSNQNSAKKRSPQTGTRGAALPGATAGTRKTTWVDRRLTRYTAWKIPSSVKEYQSQEQRRTTQAIQGNSRRAIRVSKRFWNQDTRYADQSPRTFLKSLVKKDQLDHIAMATAAKPTLEKKLQELVQIMSKMQAKTEEIERILELNREPNQGTRISACSGHPTHR